MSIDRDWANGVSLECARASSEREQECPHCGTTNPSSHGDLCERMHQWRPVRDDDRCISHYDCIVQGCNQTRTVDELWREDMPKSENPMSRIWFIYNYTHWEGWSEPTVRTIQGMKRYSLSMDRYRFWHGPGAIIKAPPAPGKISP